MENKLRGTLSIAEMIGEVVDRYAVVKEKRGYNQALMDVGSWLNMPLYTMNSEGELIMVTGVIQDKILSLFKEHKVDEQ